MLANSEHFSEEFIENLLNIPDHILMKTLEELRDNHGHLRESFARFIHKNEEKETDKLKNSIHIILRYAAFHGYSDLIEWIFSDKSIRALLKDNDGKIINLIYEIRTAVYKNHHHILRILLENNENNAILWDELFDYAAGNNQIETANLLIEKISHKKVATYLENSRNFNISCLLISRITDWVSCINTVNNLMDSLKETPEFHPISANKLSILLNSSHMNSHVQGTLFIHILFKLRNIYIHEFIDHYLKIKKSDLNGTEDAELTQYLAQIKALPKIESKESMNIYFKLKDYRPEIQTSVIDFLLYETPTSQNIIGFLVMSLFVGYIDFQRKTQKEQVIKPWLEALNIFLRHPQWKKENLATLEEMPVDELFDELICTQFEKAKENNSPVFSNHFWQKPSILPQLEMPVEKLIKVR